MKKILPILLCLALLTGLLGACGTKDEPPYTPTGDGLEGVSTPTEPEKQSGGKTDIVMCYNPDATMNPYTCGDLTNRALMSFLYQGLFAVDRDYSVIPVLCNRYKISADMKTHTFFLGDARFSDGTALTAADVAASLEAAKKGDYYRGRFQHLGSVEAQGGTVVITTDIPMENLPILLDIPIVKAGEVAVDRPLGTGPYQLESSGEELVLRRQTAWWCALPLTIDASTILLRGTGVPSEIRDNFEFSDVNLVLTDPGSDTYADYRCDYEIWDCENGLFLYLVCNSESAVFSNDSVRRALTHAIDRDRLSDEFYNGFARGATLPASPLSPVYTMSLAEKYDYAPDKMREALSTAGQTGATVTLLLNSDDTLRLRAGRAIAQMLTDCGLTVKIVELNTKEFRSRAAGKDYDLYLGQTKLSANMDLSAFFKQEGSLSYGGLADPAIYAMSQEALTNSGIFYNLHKMVMDDAQLCPLLFRSYGIYTRRGMLPDLYPSRDRVLNYSGGQTLEDITETG